jgi:hypothetical protein
MLFTRVELLRKITPLKKVNKKEIKEKKEKRK